MLSIPQPKAMLEKLFIDKSSHPFTGPKQCLGNVHHFIIRSLLLDFVKRNSHLISGDVIDLGCGSSPYKQLLTATSSIKSYTGIDLPDSPFHPLLEGNLTWNGSDIPLADASCDCVIMTEVMEHLPNCLYVLKEVNRVLRPSGVLVATVPFLYPLHEEPFDFQRFTPYGVELLLADSGYQKTVLTRLGGWDLCLAHMIGLWILSRNMSLKLRRLLLLLLYPFYSILVRLEPISRKSGVIKDNMYIGLGIVAFK
jgi:SAM-dependent methyltransferase